MTVKSKKKKARRTKKRLDAGNGAGFDSLIEPQKTPDPERSGGQRTHGRVTGLGILQFVFNLLDLNERLPKKKKMTNEELKRQLLAEFPNRSAKISKSFAAGHTTINFYRYLYNRGRLVRGKAPTRISFRYDVDGHRVRSRDGTTVLTSAEERQWLEKFA